MESVGVKIMGLEVCALLSVLLSGVFKISGIMHFASPLHHQLVNGHPNLCFQLFLSGWVSLTCLLLAEVASKAAYFPSCNSPSSIRGMLPDSPVPEWFMRTRSCDWSWLGVSRHWPTLPWTAFATDLWAVLFLVDFLDARKFGFQGWGWNSEEEQLTNTSTTRGSGWIKDPKRYLGCLAEGREDKTDLNRMEGGLLKFLSGLIYSFS